MVTIQEVKNSIIYERLNDDSPKRTVQEHVDIIKETTTQLILRAYFRWIPLFPNCDMFTVQSDKDICISNGFTFQEMLNLNTEIKKQNDVLIIGAIPAQRIFQNAIPSLGIGEYNDYTGEILTPVQTESMALNPLKWGIISPTKSEIQKELTTMSGLGGEAWYPDITNPDVQNLQLGWAKRQIDSNVDGIWIDLLYYQAMIMASKFGVTHPSAIQSYLAANQLVDNIRAYGNTIGRTIYVGTWANSAMILTDAFGIKPNLDFLTATPSPAEVLAMKLNTDTWNSGLAKIRNVFGDTPIFVFLDSTDDNAPIAKFSQKLNSVEQSQFLVTANDYYKSVGVIFSFPVHGLYLGQTATKLSFGKYRWYDSKAPEFNTYDTIRQIMTGQIVTIPPSREGNGKIVLAAFALGGLYLIFKKK